MWAITAGKNILPTLLDPRKCTVEIAMEFAVSSGERRRALAAGDLKTVRNYVILLPLKELPSCRPSPNKF